MDRLLRCHKDRLPLTPVVRGTRLVPHLATPAADLRVGGGGILDRLQRFHDAPADRAGRGRSGFQHGLGSRLSWRDAGADPGDRPACGQSRHRPDTARPGAAIRARPCPWRRCPHHGTSRRPVVSSVHPADVPVHARCRQGLAYGESCAKRHRRARGYRSRPEAAAWDRAFPDRPNALSGRCQRPLPQACSAGRRSRSASMASC